MRYICAICSESIEKSPGGLEGDLKQSTPRLLSNLSAAPCGHVFHSYCINKWMSSGVPSSNLCPNCRKCIPGISCLELFPDSYDDISNPNSPSNEKVKCEQHEQEVANLRSKLHTVEADFKIQLSLYELLAQDHQQRIRQFNEDKRIYEIEVVNLKAEIANTKHQSDMELQKLKQEVEVAYHKLEAERNGRIVDQKKHLEFFQKVASQMQTQQIEILSYSLQFQRDSPSQKTDEPKPGPSRFCKPYKSRPSVIYSKPRPSRRGKKMVYERSPDPDDIQEVDLEESDDDDDLDIMAGPDSRKRKLMCLRPNQDFPKLKVKRIASKELSLSPITLTLSSDTEDEHCGCTRVVDTPESQPQQGPLKMDTSAG